MQTDRRSAFYALQAGSWRDYVTLLHLPFTVWHLSYIVLGAASSPVINLDRLGWVVLAFFLAVGLGAHALDEWHGRPLSTSIPNPALLFIAVVSLMGALIIGVFASFIINLWTVLFVFFGAFMVLAYNLEVWGGRFHSDIWFGLSWGGFPALTGYWANAEALDVEAFLVAGSCVLLSLAQRTLSSQAKRVRRKARKVTGRIEYHDSNIDYITSSSLIAIPESALRLLSLSVPVMALGWLVARL